MREKIYFLAKGNFTYEPPSLVIEPKEVRFEVVAGGSGSSGLTVTNSRNTRVKGFGFVSQTGVTFLPVFDSEKNELNVDVDAKYLIAGTKLTGKLILVTDCGEAFVPYEVDIVSPELIDEDGEKVNDYFTLQKKTESKPANGLKLFRDPMFRETFLYRDPEGQLIYDRLLETNSGMSGMEEFLVAFDKKKPVRFALESAVVHDGVIEYELSGSDIEDSILINLNAWGSIAVRVDVTGDFIETERKLLWTDEFGGLRGRLGFKVISGKVSEGRHTGRITFTSPYETHSIEIRVHSPAGSKERKIRRAKRAVEAMLIRSIIAHEEGKVSKKELVAFLQKHSSVLEKLDLKYMIPLKGYMALLMDSEVSKLEFYRNTEMTPKPGNNASQTEVENYVLSEYIKYLYSGRDEDKQKVNDLIREYSGSGYMGTILLLTGMRTGMEQYTSDVKCVERLRELLAGSNNSPLVCSEVMKYYIRNPELLRTLDAVNLRVLLYGLRSDMVTSELADIITVLSEGRGLPLIEGAGSLYSAGDDPLGHGTGALLMRVLFGVYEKYPSTDILRNICSLLIRYEKREPAYFDWYKKGVEETLRLTDLFEYYMYTADTGRDEPLPHSVLSYFQYENHLNDTKKAFLFSNIIKNREENPTAFESYYEQIKEFVIYQIGRERVTSDLGYLYSEILTEDDIETVSEHLPHIMFRHLLTCQVPGIESVTVIHLQSNVERTYPLDRGRALMDIYTPDYRLFFSDREGNQYIGSIDYELTRFYDGDKFAKACYPSEGLVRTTNKNAEKPDNKITYDLGDASVHDHLLISLAQAAEKNINPDPVDLDVLFRALASKKLRDDFHGRVFMRIYDYISRSVPGEEKNAYLKLLMNYLKPETIKRGRIGDVATDCIRCGRMEEASILLTKFGTDGCGEDELAELTIDRIRNAEYEFNDDLVKWALMLYNKGHKDHPILNYLLQYYMGETGVFEKLFRDAVTVRRIGTGAAQMESFEGNIRTNPGFFESVRERLLGQVLFAVQDVSAVEDIFLKYYDDGENRVLVKAFLSEIAYEYIVGKTDFGEQTYEKIYRQAVYSRDEVMVLAACKKLSGKESLNEKEKEFVNRSLEELASDGCILPFMKDFAGKAEVPGTILTPVIVQYYSSTPDGVFLFVKNKNGEYESRPMTKVFDGIFIASVLLFAGEETFGYIYEEETGKRSREFELKKKEAVAGADSVFEQVNAIIEAKNNNDTEKYESLSKAFVMEQELAKSLFTLL
ncbi:MAG: hypothetical protein J6P16_01140 [Eubacterium sp.]|nr:hypothetical protein [Eubacterium sp.]